PTVWRTARAKRRIEDETDPREPRFGGKPAIAGLPQRRRRRPSFQGLQECRNMLNTKKAMTAGLVGAVALVASSLAAVSPASAAWYWRGGHWGWFAPAIGFGAGVALGSVLSAPYYGYGYGYDYGPNPYAYGPPAYSYASPAYAYNDADAYC